MRARLQYGTSGLEVDLPAANVTLLEPRFLPGLPDEAAAFREAVEHPLAGPPLRELVRATDRVAVVIPDLTRPLPTHRLLPWLFAALDHVPPEAVHHRQRHGLAPRQHRRRSCGGWWGRRCSPATGW